MTSQSLRPRSNTVSRASVATEKEARRATSIAWTELPEPATTEQRERRGRRSIDSTTDSPPGRPRALSSPPPPPSFQKRVSFDTFDNKDATDFSLTLKSKHRDYSYSRRSRTFLCGTDSNEYSEFALEWLLDELVDDGDEIVCLRVVDKDNQPKMSSEAADGQERSYRHEARSLLDWIISKNDEDKAISIILEFAVGKVHETIQRMIHIYEPVILIVGTRGRSLGGLQGLLPGSVSKYCLQHSPVPVIVVRPSSKRDKKKAKRQADPNRKIYQDIIQQSSGLLSSNADGSIASVTLPDTSTSMSSLGEVSGSDKRNSYTEPNEDDLPSLRSEDGQIESPDSLDSGGGAALDEDSDEEKSKG